ncbi:DUF7490 domain-containing protein [Natrarchaeobius chitinivorans]|uniref:DUF7490 domain-containing protein n=1 Tax=Natrarchaeobius chitinivorans TaxID=1679083 RepID=A0A3N6NCR9_NATCH|nr:hypothetical protein [Natrarchaeobius chitinivorans]RQG96552.1 hypothetical protein EA473_05425 [Natrarchaeobius chitinivorans]
MNREYALAVAALVVVVAALTTLALSGAIADPADPDADASVHSQATLQEVTIAADEVSGESATLAVDTYLYARGGPVENVTVVHRATNTDTGLLEDTTEREVGTLEAEIETTVSETIDVPRDGSHEIETLVYVDGTRTESRTHRVSGVDSLTPAYADTGLEFHRFGGDYGGAFATVPAIEYSIESTSADDATLEVTSYLTNTGDETADSLELEVKARQADSNIVADSETVPISDVESGETATPTATLEVTDEYSYYLDAVLWLDGTIVATERGVADLRPESVVANETDTESYLDTGDFETDDGFEAAEADSDRPEPVDDDLDTEDEYDSTPGFGVVGATVGAAVVLALAAIRRKR